MPNTRPLKVFLCHASADKPAVRELSHRLASEDWIDPWLDEEKLSFGQHWTTIIEEALDAADIVIIFLSRNSVQKEGFVQRELNYAWELSLEKPRNVIFLIPLRLDDCEVPRYLRSRQWGDFFEDKKESTYQILLRSLKQRHEQKLRLEAEEQKQRDALREKAERDAVEKALREKADREAKEKAERENTEKIARMKVAVENDEKIAREKAERTATEKTACEKVARENTAKTAHELLEERESAKKTVFGKSDRDIKEKIEGVKAARDVNAALLRMFEREQSIAISDRTKDESTALPHKELERKKTGNKPFPVSKESLWLIFIFSFFIAISIFIAVNWHPSTPIPAEIATFTALPIPTETFTTLPFPTETPTPESTIIPTPALDIGSTMIGNDGMMLLYVPAGEFTIVPYK